MTDNSSSTTDNNYTQPESKSLWQRLMEWKEAYRRGRLERAQRRGPVWEWIEMILTVLVMVFVIRLVIVEAFRIPTGSMEDTMLVGDFLLVNKFIYGISSPDWIGIPFTRIGFFIPHFRLPSFKEPKSGDVVVFRYPLDPNLSYIKRCIATEGQTVEIHDKKIFVDGELLKDPPHSKFVHNIIYSRNYRDKHILPGNMEMRNRDNFGPIVVPPGKMFMMGDNRDNSADSRYWGFLDRDMVIGKALIIYFSWDAEQPLSKLNRLIRWERIGNVIR